MGEYRIDWKTEIIDRDDMEGTEPRFPVVGHTIVEATSLSDAFEIAENMVDVDFFVPKRSFSASDARVLRGEMTATYHDDTRTGDNMDAVLPEVEEWNFEVIDILGVKAE